MSRSTFHSSSMYTTRIATQIYGQSTTTYLRVGIGGGWARMGRGRAAEGGGGGGALSVGIGRSPLNTYPTPTWEASESHLGNDLKHLVGTHKEASQSI